MAENELSIKIRSFLNKYKDNAVEIDDLKFVISRIDLIEPIPHVRLGEFKIELSLAGQL